MSVKCPSCGFESADGAQWCDMCKQPFNKARPAAAQAVKDPPKAPEDLKKAPADELLKKLASEEQKVPPVPPWARMAAWVFLGMWIIFGCILAGVYMARYEDARNRAPVSQNAAD